MILGGKATFEAAGKRFVKVGGRPNVFAGKPHSVYMPAGTEYTIAAEGAVQIALTSAPSDLETEPYVICSGPGHQRQVGRGQFHALLSPDPDRGRAARPAGAAG